MNNKIRQIDKFIGSPLFFYLTVVLFALETIQLSVTSRFPMAFDESYHFGLIMFFSHRVNPILSQQPPSSYRFGNIIQNPSFVYHYLMSYPYRFIELFSKDYVTQVIFLRLINVAIAVATIFVIRKILKLFNLSVFLSNLVVFIFAFMPITAILSAQINYDNLLILLSVLIVYKSLKFIDKLKQKKFDYVEALLILLLCLINSLVKFAFLPIFLAVVAVILWCLYKNRARLKGYYANEHLLVILAVFNILALALFFKYYGENVIKYHNPEPQCNQILTINDCKQYYSWDYNYLSKNYGESHPHKIMNVFEYTGYWIFYVSIELVSDVFPLRGYYYTSPILYVSVVIITIAATTSIIVNFRRIFSDDRYQAIFIISAVYLLFLWGRLYYDYNHLGHEPAAIDGRYLVPVLLYMLIWAAKGISILTRHKPLTNAKYVAVYAVIIISLVLGGSIQYITLITPKYGRLYKTNNFILQPASP